MASSLCPPEAARMELKAFYQMSESSPEQDTSLLREWRQKIEVANRNSIFCHCRHCGVEWVDSSFDAACNRCGSSDVEHISCWQFPDD